MNAEGFGAAFANVVSKIAAVIARRNGIVTYRWPSRFPWLRSVCWV